MSGTVTALGSALLGLTACVLVGGVSQAATEDARASAAADLAALAAADAHRGAPGNGGRTGAVDPCPLAASVAARNGTQLAECTVEDSGSVRVTVTSERLFGITARTESRAGPPRDSGLPSSPVSPGPPQDAAPAPSESSPRDSEPSVPGDRPG
ncbi:Rv3654c family TadE-like protein [uncultured Micrococcus sp.]|uniref:Rv3654c family TadE-like protein n=1 Tax=uncultured Micrococcus sp. TaxID=114051 RepID=UPI002593FB56|nr:Rv3654c family TadE-like protein [uncultured Micrococcus sp.]